MKKILILFALLALFTIKATANDGEIFQALVTHIAPDGTQSYEPMRFIVESEKHKYVSIIGKKDEDGTIFNSLLGEDKAGEIVVPEKVYNNYIVHSVGKYAFYMCPAKVTLPETVGEIEDNAFMDYQYDGYDFKLPSYVHTIGHAAFLRAKIKGISLNAGLSYIYSSAFGESDIESLVIPGSVTVIGTGITAGCNQLEYLAVTYTNETYYSDQNVVIESKGKKVVAGCKSSVIPDDVQSIDHDVFWGTHFDKPTITIPESVTSIGTCAFQETNIKHLIIRSKTLEIGAQAFMYNYQMERLDFYGGDVTINSIAFKFCTALKEMWCHDHKPIIPESEHEQFYGVGPNWSHTTHNGQTKIFAKYPDEFTDEVEGIGNIWEYWFYPHIYGLDENPVIGSIYIDDYTWPAAGDNADFSAISLTEHATVSQIQYRYGTKIIDPSPYGLGEVFDIAFTINLDEGYTFADNAVLFVDGKQNDIFVKRSDTERVFIIQNCTVPTPPGGVAIESISIRVAEPEKGQPLSTTVTDPTGRFYDRAHWVIDRVVWKGDNLDSYDPTKDYILTAYVHAKTNYRFDTNIAAKLNGRTASVKHGTNSEGIPTLEFSIHYGMQVYTVFDSDNKTLTYYYDNQMDSRPGVKEVYDPYVVRFKDYQFQVVKAVIDPSMKDAALTDMSNLFFGRVNNETGEFYHLPNLAEIEGLENLNTSQLKWMDQMFRCCLSLKSVDVSSFNTSNVLSMMYAFQDCTSLKELDLTNFKTDNLLTISGMFDCCSSLTTIYCNDDWSELEESFYNVYPPFRGCIALVGGKGTKYDKSMIDVIYARPDGGEASPGYFTIKPSLRGDLNGDKKVDIADAVCVLNVMAAGGGDLTADLNGDGKVDIADFVTVLDIMAQQ